MGLDDAPQRRAIDVLHHKVMEVVGLLDRVDVDDVGVAQGGYRLSLQPEPRDHGLVRQEVRSDDLDRDHASECDVLPEVDRPHGSATQLAENFELASRGLDQLGRLGVPQRHVRDDRRLFGARGSALWAELVFSPHGGAALQALRGVRSDVVALTCRGLECLRDLAAAARAETITPRDFPAARRTRDCSGHAHLSSRIGSGTRCPKALSPKSARPGV